jgi:hypothetical protein
MKVAVLCWHCGLLVFRTSITSLKGPALREEKISQSNNEIGFGNDKGVHASVTQIADPLSLRFWSASRMKSLD